MSALSDYSTVTEAPGDALRPEALDMLATRYAAAAARARGRRVLEAGCGPGQGLGMLSRAARFTVGGDYTAALLRHAAASYGSRVPLLQFDAQALPFASGSFDLIIFYEAIYYLPNPSAFVTECRRVLSDDGEVLLCSANRLLPDFNPSPYSVRYFSSEELRELFEARGFSTALYGAFRAIPETARDRLVSFIKRTAVALHLVPKTMKGKALLKRLFFGPLNAAPAELVAGVGAVHTPVPLPAGVDDREHRVLFLHARRAAFSTE